MLTDYQVEIVNKIIKTPKCGIFLGMGLGKTLATLVAISDLMILRQEVKRVLIIAPKRVAQYTWQEEIDKWGFPLKYRVLMGPAGLRQNRVKNVNKSNTDIYIINRENVVWLINYLKVERMSWPFDMVVIDESSSFKNHTSKRFKALKTQFAHIKRMVLLSGTPTPRGYMNLWSQMFLLDNGKRLEPTITAFRWKYFTPGKSKGFVVYDWVPKNNADKVIKHNVKDICFGLESSIRVKKPVINDVYCRMSERELTDYAIFRKELLLQTDKGEITAANAASLSNKLLQYASGAVYTESGKEWVRVHDNKLRALKDIIDESNGQNILVFYNYIHEKERILKAFKEAEVLDVNKWNKGKQVLALAHAASCGHGLNLQSGGHIMVWFSPTFDLELYLQANARLARTGQKEPVVIHRLLCKDTRDIEAIKALGVKDYTQKDFMRSILLELKAQI